ncbi:MAG: 30S ribosomal protein S6 [Bacteroidota bacterium]
MENLKNNYETTVIINAALEDNQVESIIARIQETIAKNNGEISAVNKWGRKRLSYPIKKKNNGFFANIEFKSTGDIVRLLESSYTLEEQILRFLTIKLDEKALKAKAMGPVPLPDIAADVIPEIKVPLKEPLFDADPPA